MNLTHKKKSSLIRARKGGRITLMNMLSPMNFKKYSAINNNLLNVYNEVAPASISTAANETKETISKASSINDISACQVSVDETWQKRGYQSLNDIVTAVFRENSAKVVLIGTKKSQHQDIKIGK